VHAPQLFPLHTKVTGAAAASAAGSLATTAAARGNTLTVLSASPWTRWPAEASRLRRAVHLSAPIWSQGWQSPQFCCPTPKRKSNHAALGAAATAGVAAALRYGGSRARSGGGRSFSSTTTRAVSSVASPDGEWAFRASVLGCEGALSGHVFLDPSGRAAYVADGAQVVGRGIGHWTSGSGGVLGLELDVYQYAAAAVDIPEKPHRFRGVWATNGSSVLQGDWYFCPEDGGAPRLVGGFDAAPTTSDLLPVVNSGAGRASPSPKIHGAERDMLMYTLDVQRPAKVPKPQISPEDRLAPYKVGDVDSVYYIPNWVEKSQEADFMHIADGNMAAWEDMRTRSTQEWGAGGRCSCGRGLMREPLPPTQQPLADALHHLGVFDGALYPMNSVRINGYRPGQGIYPHCDGAVYYPKVAILSLGSPCIFSFFHESGTEDCTKWDKDNDVPGGHVGGQPLSSVLLEPRSLLVFGRDAFWKHRHGISQVARDEVTSEVCNLHMLDRPYKVGDRVDRTRRVSLTMRHLLPRCACQG